MPLHQSILLGIIQGITEFLPISSSAHLIWVPQAFHFQPQELSIDVALHFGTLGVIFVYFWKDICLFIRAGLKILTRGRIQAPHTAVNRLQCLIIATLPVLVSGYILNIFGRNNTPSAIGWSSIVFGLLLYGADRFGKNNRSIDNLSHKEAFFIWGLAQALAIVPGASRFGTCLTAGRLWGYPRNEAITFSFLISAPSIFAAMTLKGYQHWQSAAVWDWTALAIGSGTAFCVGLVLFRWIVAFLLQKGTFLLFAIYRMILGIGLLFWL